MRFNQLARSLLILLAFTASACAGVEVEEAGEETKEPIPTLPDDRPLLLEVLPLAAIHRRRTRLRGDRAGYP